MYYYDNTKDLMVDEALDQLEKEGKTLSKTIYYPTWDGKQWTYQPITNQKYKVR